VQGLAGCGVQAGDPSNITLTTGAPFRIGVGDTGVEEGVEQAARVASSIDDPRKAAPVTRPIES
jgi:hypothetical protein